MRKARRTALVATLCVAVLEVGTARADWQTDRAEAVASKVWHNPCGGAVTLLSQTPPQPDWRAWTFPETCTVVLSNTQPWRWRELCPVLMHEYGHLAGYTDPLNPSDPHHSHDPRDIMSPYEHYDPRCDGYGAPFLGLVAPPSAREPKQTAAQHRRRHRKRHRVHHKPRHQRHRRAVTARWHGGVSFRVPRG